MLYLAQLLGQPVRDRHGNRLARIQDLVVALPAPAAAADLATRYDTYPRLHGLVAKGGRTATGFFVPLAAVASLGRDGAQLATPDVHLEAFTRRPHELLLAGDLTDHPVIDCRQATVRRVNDVLIGTDDEAGAMTLAAPLPVGGPYPAADLVLLGVDVGWTGLLRRLNLLGSTLGVLGALGKRLAPSVLPWPDVALTGPQQTGRQDVLSGLHPADLARLTDALSYREAAGIIAGLDDETAADVLEEVDPERATDIMEQLPDSRAADIIEEMGPDDASDLLADLPEARAAGLLREMEPEAAEDVRELLRYPDDSAGGLMTTSFVTCPRRWTVQQTIALLRGELEKPDLVYYIYITDGPENDHLVGVVTLRKLLIADPADRMEEIMRIDVESAAPTDNPRAVARTMAEYNLLALPVLDAAGRILGIVTVDDAIAVLLPSGWQRKLNRIFSS
ncbi:MAG TPA: CBS domain-containing protein [Chloroflexia bacterium]|nr:CBS domain-containing protein [Chloroflexia bacterium]